MEYIVHASKNQNDSNFKLTLERVCWNECDVSICFYRSWSRIGCLWLDTDPDNRCVTKICRSWSKHRIRFQTNSLHSKFKITIIPRYTLKKIIIITTSHIPDTHSHRPLPLTSLRAFPSSLRYRSFSSSLILDRSPSRKRATCNRPHKVTECYFTVCCIMCSNNHYTWSCSTDIKWKNSALITFTEINVIWYLSKQKWYK